MATATTLAFESIVVRDSGSPSSKEFGNLSIEVAPGGKDIFIGSNYKIKWKNVVSLKFEDCEDDRYGDDFDDGFELICNSNGNSNSGGNGNSGGKPTNGYISNNTGNKNDRNDNSSRRSFVVRFPLETHPRLSSWKSFSALLKGAYQKECRKRQRKRDRQDAELEKDQKQQQLQQQRGRQRGRARSRTTTYSKRPYDFMRKNASNIAHNAEVWSDDDEDHEHKHKHIHIHKQNHEDRQQQEVAEEIGGTTIFNTVDDDDHDHDHDNNRIVHNNQNDNDDDDDDDDDDCDKGEEFQHDLLTTLAISANRNSNSNTNTNTKNGNDDGKNRRRLFGKTKITDDVDEEDDNYDDWALSIEAAKANACSKERPFCKGKYVNDRDDHDNNNNNNNVPEDSDDDSNDYDHHGNDNDNDDDDDDEAASATTTASKAVQRVVTPGVASLTSSRKYRAKQKTRRCLDDDDDDDDNDVDGVGVGNDGDDQQQHDQDQDQPQPSKVATDRNNGKKKSINSFFQPRSARTSTKAIPTGTDAKPDLSRAKTRPTKSSDSDATHEDESVNNNTKGWSSLLAVASLEKKVSHKESKDNKETEMKTKTMTTPTPTNGGASSNSRRSSSMPVKKSFFAPRWIKQNPSATHHLSPNSNNNNNNRKTTPTTKNPQGATKTKRKRFLTTTTTTKTATTSDVDSTSDSDSTSVRSFFEQIDPVEQVVEGDDSLQSRSLSPSYRQALFSSSSSSSKRSDKGGRSPTSIKRRRLRLQGSSRSALEALEFADARTLRDDDDRHHHHHHSSSSSRVRDDPRLSEEQIQGMLEEDMDTMLETGKIFDDNLQPATGVEHPPGGLGLQVEWIATDRDRKWRGLCNDGNSCYVNSSLQQLFSVSKFMEALHGRREGHELTTSLSNLHKDLFFVGEDNKNNSGNRSRKTRHDGAAGSARPVKDAMDRLTDRFRGCEQRDAHEFLGELMDQIHEELSPSASSTSHKGDNKDDEIKNKNEGKEDDRENKDTGASELSRKGGDSGAAAAEVVEPTDEFFRWNVQVCLECKHCGYSRSKEEMHRYLSIDIGHKNFDPRDPEFVKPAVDSCLAKFFSPEDREINCEKCMVGKIATQTMKILSLPKVILLHLKRFIAVERHSTFTDKTELVFKKNKVPVELSQTLSIDKTLLVSKNSDSKESTVGIDKYSLKSIVHHIGDTANSGHYTTDALRKNPKDGTDQWVSYDDGVTYEKSPEAVALSTTNQKTAYMLLYTAN